MIDRFNVRVYGIIQLDGKVLLLKEQYKEEIFVKFPGGGLEYGEGTRDCVIRELKEELNLNVEIESHFYTTEFFQKSFFIFD